MTALDVIAIDQRLKALEARQREVAAATPTTTTPATTTTATTVSGTTTFLGAPLLVDQSAAPDDFRSWTAYSPGMAGSAVILAWEMGEMGGTLGERRIDLSIDGGANVFPIGRLDVIGSGADFGTGTTCGPLPCRSDGSFDYQVIGASLEYWKLYVVGWIS